KEWIMEYGNEEFAKEVKSVLELINKWAEKVDEKTYSLMTETFLEATQFEYDFWDYAYSFKKDSISLSE
ncbi:MAG TPA: hypothetical protein DDY68_01650, partial [Porphyromonadaceae bacterium]|nr:hypothetical protein [Porphyromonadaceae bacterium]